MEKNSTATRKAGVENGWLTDRPTSLLSYIICMRNGKFFDDHFNIIPITIGHDSQRPTWLVIIEEIEN